MVTRRTPRSDPDEESLVRSAARRVARGLRREAATPQFGRLLAYQATSAGGDALLALALAGTLFFWIPPADARGRVALYLVLTVAPFAVVSPLLARFLDRGRGRLRAMLIFSAAGRAVLAFLLSSRLESSLLFPISFGILILSRAVLVVRGAVLPQLVPPRRTLVAANAALSKIGGLAAVGFALPGLALLRWPGVDAELMLCALVYAAGVVPALGVPTARGRRNLDEHIQARATVRSVSIRQAVVVAAGVRLLVGFLTFHLAFALRREEIGTVGLGVFIGIAATGALLGALLAGRLRRRLKEEGILVFSLAAAATVAVLSGRWFSVVNAGALVLTFGVMSGAAKVAFDAIVQRETSEAARGWAFARFESILQVAWVTGAVVPLLVALSPGTGVFAVGILGNLLAIAYTFGRHRVRSSAIPYHRASGDSKGGSA